MGPNNILHHFVYRPLEVNECCTLYMQWHIFERPYLNLNFLKRFFNLSLYFFPEIPKKKKKKKKSLHLPTMTLGPFSHARAQIFFPCTTLSYPGQPFSFISGRWTVAVQLADDESSWGRVFFWSSTSSWLGGILQSWSQSKVLPQ